ncbi:hypothetical protein HDU97_005876 [Phlyctochytrium planicorne]|nr:hypothetical protein HDU97_005876 [Phlyctochytrium planicorne]
MNFLLVLSLVAPLVSALPQAGPNCNSKSVYQQAQSQLWGYNCALNAFYQHFNEYNACTACDFNTLANAVGPVLSDPNCKDEVARLYSKVNDLTIALNQACGKGPDPMGLSGWNPCSRASKGDGPVAKASSSTEGTGGAIIVGCGEMICVLGDGVTDADADEEDEEDTFGTFGDGDDEMCPVRSQCFLRSWGLVLGLG